MKRWRAILGLLAGGFLLLSAFAHSIVGTAAMKLELAKTNVPDELARGLILGWHLGGAAQFIFAAITLWTFICGLRGVEVSLVPTLLLGLGYLAFTAFAFPSSGYEPFFLVVFGLPGVLLTVVSAARRQTN